MATPETKSSKPAPKSEKAAVKKSRAMGAKRAPTPRRADDAPAVASPAAAGPSGALLEGHVGAQYLLPLLQGGEARGLPGVVVSRVAFQRAGLGHPMDDVIVTGHDGQGRPATLEVQAKRTIAFTVSDSVFADVVALASRAAVKPEFDATRYELAVAIARTSAKIEQHIQDVLTWAREYQSPEVFFRRLNQPGAAHQGMRDFVEAFRGHMQRAGAVHDDAAVWRLLRRFQVLAFDFEQAGSMCSLYARERCAALLAPQEVGRAGQLWDSLQQIALEVDAAGGDLDPAALRERIADECGYRLAGDRRLHAARDQLAEAAENTLAAIGSRVHGVSLDRAGRVSAALSALEQGRYLEIRGAGGVGKSGVLKNLAQRVGVESRVVVVAPHRVPGGGWPALQAQLGCDANARELLTDLAGYPLLPGLQVGLTADGSAWSVTAALPPVSQGRDFYLAVQTPAGWQVVGPQGGLHSLSEGAPVPLGRWNQPQGASLQLLGQGGALPALPVAGWRPGAYRWLGVLVDPLAGQVTGQTGEAAFTLP